MPKLIIWHNIDTILAQSRQSTVGYCYRANVTVCIDHVLSRQRRPLSTVKIYRPPAETWPSIGPIRSESSLLLRHPVPKVEEPEFGPWTARYWALCHFYHGKLFWKWENQSSAPYRPVTGPKTIVGGQSLGQNWPPSAYRSHHFSNDTILATDLRQNFCRWWANVGPCLPSHLGCNEIRRNIFFHLKKKFSSFKVIKLNKLFLKFWTVQYLNQKNIFPNQINNVKKRISFI